MPAVYCEGAKMKSIEKIGVIFIGILIGACSSGAKFEYPFKSGKLSEMGLSCSDAEALNLAEKAVKDKYPSLSSKLEQNKFSVFSVSYAGSGDYVYSMKSIFDYYSIGRSDLGTFFEEYVEVVLEVDCEIKDVVYFKGNNKITY